MHSWKIIVCIKQVPAPSAAGAIAGNLDKGSDNRFRPLNGGTQLASKNAFVMKEKHGGGSRPFRWARNA